MFRTAALGMILGFFPVMACAEVPLRVEFVPVEISSERVESWLAGTIEARSEVDLSFRSGGRVTDVLVHEGARVDRGDELARIDPLQQDQNLQAADAAVSAAQATVEQARQAALRQAEMLRRGVGTRAARDAADETLNRAQSDLDQARSEAQQARRSLSETVLYAPDDGVIVARSAEPGQIVSAAQPVLQMAGLDDLEAVFQIPDVELLSRAMGARVELEPLDLPGPVMRARVTDVAPIINPETGSVLVKAEIEDAPADAALLGAAVKGTIQLSAGQAIRLPWTALTSGADGPAVWVVDPNSRRVSLAPVRIDRFVTGEVLVAEGLNPGQIVVGSGSQLLFPGRAVAAGQAGEAAE